VAADKESGGGFLQKLISLFTGGDDPEREKKRLLKDIAKELKKEKYKFYKPASKEVLPGLGKWFFSFYKLFGPARVLLENAEGSGVLKTILIEAFLSEKQQAALESFEEENIRGAAESSDVKQVASRLKEELVSFFSAFDNETVKEINATYNRIQIFHQLIDFDYYFLLKKFDSNIQENNFSYSPNFDSLNGEYVSDDLKDFLSILHLIDPEADWDAVFNVLQKYKGQDVVNRGEWKKALKALVAVRRSSILQLIVKHIDDDPFFKVTIYPPKEKIVEGYLSKMKTQAEMTIQKILQEKRNSKIDKLAIAVFGTPAVSRMKFYTEKANMVFSKRMLGGFLYITPMNYLKAFLLDFVKRDIKEIVDILLIKGQWASHVMSQQLSESFHHLLELSDRLLKFDEALADEGELGAKLKGLVTKADRDPNSMSVLKQQIKDINEKAQLLLKSSAQNLITVAKNLKQCLEDYQKQPHEIIINWKELEGPFEGKVKEKIAGIYKTIYYFIQLLQFFVK
jgi:hypothetical protein